MPIAESPIAGGKGPTWRRHGLGRWRLALARAWGAYDVALEDLGPILKWHGNVSGRVTGNPASDSTFAFSNSQMNVDISCGEDQIEYQFVKSAGGSFPSEASGSDSPGDLVDVADGPLD